MIDIYRNALLGETNRTNNLVNAAVNAINQNGGSTPYAPYAAGTPTLGAQELAETTRNNSMENQYKNSSLKETARNNDLQNQYNMGTLAETKRNNDLQQTYRMGSMASDVNNNNAQLMSAENIAKMQYGDKMHQNIVTEAESKVKASIYAAMAKGADITTIKRNILANGAQLAADGVDVQAMLNQADAMFQVASKIATSGR